MTDKMPRGRSKEVSDEELIDAIRSVNDPCFFSSEIADRITIDDEATRTRLRKLYDQGLIDGKQNGKKWTYWLNGH